MVIREDIQDAAGFAHLAAGQIACVESAVHAICGEFLQDEGEVAH